ncbi:MAG: OstA-like protein [Chitinophagaceae bacterium]
MNKFSIILVFFAIVSIQTGFSQEKKKDSLITPAQDTLKTIRIISADTFRRVLDIGAYEKFKMVGNVVIQQGNTMFYCDSAIQDVFLNQIEAFGNVHINDADTVQAYSQYLKYLGNEKIAHLQKKVRLTDGKGTLTTDDLEYDMNSRLGTYRNGGKVVNGKTIMTSKEGYYYAETREAYFIKDVKLNDPEYKVSTDSLLYDMNNSLATFIAPTEILDGNSRIFTKSGFYDMKNGVASFGDRPILKDSSQEIIADHVNFDKQTGNGIAVGNVVYKDTAQGIAILAGETRFNNKINEVLATKKPLLIIKQEKDSLYIASDTLFSGRMPSPPKQDSLGSINTQDSIKFFRAYHHVRIFSDSLQAVCDSLHYSDADSTFRLYNDPILWSNDNQLYGDSILLKTRNKKADELKVLENGFALSKTKENFYNQLRGTTIIGFFEDGKINMLNAKGSAESIYYIQDDDSSYVGMNYSKADVIGLHFGNNGLEKVNWINSVEGTTYPMGQVPSDKKQLKNFRWMDDRRPKNKWELFQ